MDRSRAGGSGLPQHKVSYDTLTAKFVAGVGDGTHSIKSAIPLGSRSYDSVCRARKMEIQSNRRQAHALIALAIVCGLVPWSAKLGYPQQPPSQPPRPTTSAATAIDNTRQSPTTIPELAPAITADAIQSLFAELQAPDFQSREQAKHKLSQHPQLVIEQIERTIGDATPEKAAKLVELLDYFACSNEFDVAVAAFNTLERLAACEGTFRGYLAGKCLSALKSVKESTASEVLRYHGVEIGYLPISVNGSAKDRSQELTVSIDSTTFTGSIEVLEWLQYLQKVEIASLQGPGLDVRALAAIAKMPSLKKVLLRSISAKPEDLLILKNVKSLEHLELAYWPYGDEMISMLTQLPITESLRLFGTKVTDRGEQMLRDQLDGLEIYRGSGGFLGIGSSRLGPVVVNQIVEGGAAMLGGIQRGDTITKINGVEIPNFDELRRQLARYAAGEKIQVLVKRGIDEKNLEITLLEQQ